MIRFGKDFSDRKWGVATVNTAHQIAKAVVLKDHAGFVVAVWALQLWWSTWWLERFWYGPFEWAWRCATYRKLQPIRR